ncbi:hypothetical protein N431DRAFT_503049 [Stipitochalara longipes BDJ]|nr:hypothetical protein N431DRAFT_503049 [Stipitochalara longipes BDJ]
MLAPKLNKVHMYLWWCKKLPETRPLHENLMEKYEIVVTEQADLHLVCPSGRIFIKPLPRYLLCHELWASHICVDAQLFESCTGFLLSYAQRIRHESDLTIAIDHGLVPKEVTWKAWKVFVSLLLEYIDAKGGPSKCVSKRLKDYISGYGQTSKFFNRNFAWMGLAFLYLVAILTAMQVGLAAAPLRDNASFNWASYVFAVFCILLPVTIVAVHFLRHVAGLICWNWEIALLKPGRKKISIEIFMRKIGYWSRFR